MKETRDQLTPTMPTVFLQVFSNGRSPEEARFVEKELAARAACSVRAVKVLEEDVPTSPALAHFAPGDFAVGNATFIKQCLARAGVPLPPAPDYPACLAPYLHRKMWRATLGACGEGSGGAPYYVKPAEDIKAFSGEEATPAELAHLRSRFPPDFPVVCSEKVDIACEYRVYVARGVVKAVCHCPHPGCEKTPLDEAVAREAVATLEASGEALAGYGIDFCVVKKGGGAHVTALMEVNDGTTTGVYDGVSHADYTEMVEARWQQLLGGGASGGGGGSGAGVAGGGGSGE